MKQTIFALSLALALAGCGGDPGTDPATAETPGKPPPEAARTVKPMGPVQISYRIVGTPIVGQPVAIDLEVRSVQGPQAVTLSYRINDATAMQFPEAQPAEVSIAARTDEGPSQQQVRVIPLREGRLYLNVSADVETESGTLSTVTAIPIQVGGTTSRIPQQNGSLTIDQDGEQIRVVQGERQ
jgi:hypothetical protein